MYFCLNLVNKIADIEKEKVNIENEILNSH